MRYVTSTAVVPEPCYIAGTQMRPFSLGHHLLFRRLGLPFAGSPDADCGQGDILIGVLVCAQSYEQTLSELHSGEWDKTLQSWLKRVAKRRTNLDEAEKNFRAYLKAGYEMPPLWKHGGAGGIKFSAPWEMLVKVRLQMAGFSETEVLNGYLPARWIEYFTAVEISQADRCEDATKWRPIFWTHDDAARMEALRG